MIDYDTYKEHEMHYDYDPQCSECFKEKSAALKLFGSRLKEIDKSPREIDWDLLGEKSAHPGNDYW